MAGRAAVSYNLYFPKIKVNIIVDYPDALGRYLVVRGECFYCFAGLIHKCQGLCKDYFFTPNLFFGNFGFKFFVGCKF